MADSIDDVVITVNARAGSESVGYVSICDRLGMTRGYSGADGEI